MTDYLFHRMSSCVTDGGIEGKERREKRRKEKPKKSL
jgi:hypothetical protein